MSSDLNRNVLLAVAVASVAMAAISYGDDHLFAEPYHTSSLSGRAYVQELLDSTNPHRFSDVIGMPKHVFLKLMELLMDHGSFTDSRHIEMEEKLAIFLWLGRTNDSIREIAERFQRSKDTISRCAL